MAKFLKKVVGLADELFDDPKEENDGLTPDRVSGNKSTLATTSTQATSKSKTSYNASKTTRDTFKSMGYDQDMAMNNVGKLVKIGNVTMSNTTVQLSLLEAYGLPQSLYKNNKYPAHGLTRYFKYLRTGFTFEIQVNAPVGTSGAVLVVYEPSGFPNEKIEQRTLLMLPHVIVNIGDTQGCTLTIPYVSDTNYVETDSNGCGHICVYNWAPIKVPTGSTNEVDVTIYGSLDGLHLANPRPQGPTKNQITEGPGTMVLSGACNAPCNTLALDGEKMYVDSKTAGAMKPIDDFRLLTSVMLTGAYPTPHITNDWNTSQAKGTKIYSLNMTFQELNYLMKFMGNTYSYWRGAITMTVTVFTTPLHKGRLQLAYYPNCSQDYDLENANNAQYAILDLGLQNSMKLTVPYAYKNWMRSTTHQGSEDVIGRFQIYVNNKLMVNAAAANMVTYSVFFSFANDLVMIGPTDHGLNYQGKEDEEEGKTGLTDKTEQVDQGSVDEIGVATLEGDREEPGILKEEKPKTGGIITEKTALARADHLKPRTLFKRAGYIGEFTYSSGIQVATLPIPTSGHMSLLKLFMYWSGDFTLHMLNDSSSIVEVAHTYDEAVTVSEGSLASLGCVIIPPNEMFSINVPFYSENPVRCLRGAAPLGRIMLDPRASTGHLKAWISFPEINLFFPVGVPKEATARSVMNEMSEGALTPVIKLACEAGMRGKYDIPLKAAAKPKAKKTRDVASRYLEDLGYDDTQFEWIKDLTTEGIEPNPGPIHHLVYKDRGLYKHYGVAINNEKIIHMDSENIFKSAMDGLATLVIENYNKNEWIKEQTFQISDIMAGAIQASVGKQFKYSIKDNCETWAKTVLGDDSTTLSESLVKYGCVLAAATTVCVLVSQGEGLKDAIKNTFQTVSNAAKYSAEAVKSFIAGMSLDGIKSEMVKMCGKFLLKAVCYGLLFCSSPNMITGAAVSTLIALDVGEIVFQKKDMLTKMVEAVVNGDLYDIITSVCEMEDGPVDENEVRERVLSAKAEVLRQCKTMVYERQGVKDFNAWTSGAKNIMWWLHMLKCAIDWIKNWFSPSQDTKATEWLGKNDRYVLSVLQAASNTELAIIKYGIKREKETQDKIWELVHKLKVIRQISLAAKNFSLSTTVLNAIKSLTMHTTQVVVPKEIYRVEPVGVWISGPAGCGKSSFATELMKQVTVKIKKMDPPFNTDGVYPHPIGSRHMDGYDQQFIHLFDDFGQVSDGEDTKLICNTSSSLPFTIPQAALEEKGMSYDSKLVVATTNKIDFYTNTLECPEALDRRFGYQFNIKVEKTFVIKSGPHKPEKLDLEKAYNAGAVTTGKCWIDRDTGRLFDMDGITTKIAEDIFNRYKLATKINKDSGLKYSARSEVKLPDIDLPRVTLFPQGNDDENDYESLFDIGDHTKMDDDIDKALGDLDELLNIISTTQEEYNFTKERKPGFVKKIKDMLKRDDENTRLIKKELGEAKDTSPFTFGKITNKYTPYDVTIDQDKFTWFKNTMKSAADKILEKTVYNTNFMIMAGILTTVLGAVALYTSARIYCGVGSIGACVEQIKQNIGLGEGAYSGGANGVQLKKGAPIFKPQGGDNPHSLYKYIVTLKNKTGTYHGLGIENKTILTYKHSLDALCGEIEIQYNGLNIVTNAGKMTTHPYQHQDGSDTDLVYIKLDDDVPIRFKKSATSIGKIQSHNGMLIYTRDNIRYAKEAKKIAEQDTYVVSDTGVFHKGYRYNASTMKGDCGALLVGKDGNGKWVIGGMHHAGSTLGIGVAVPIPYEEQGIIINKTKAETVRFTPTKTKLMKSPLHDGDAAVMGPAPLHPKDPRIEEKHDNLVKEAASKYRVNTFKPHKEAFEAAYQQTRTDFLTNTGVNGQLSIFDALNGFDNTSKIDMGTSPGPKYVQKGLTKKDLIKVHDGKLYPTQQLIDDVEELEHKIATGQDVNVIFGATLKDEVVKEKKIKGGQPRCIEACDLDFVVLYRMYLGKTHNAVYGTDALSTGIAVGINPLKDYNDIYLALKDKQILALDYAKFDGSLSDGLMDRAFEIMADSTTDSDMTKKILDKIKDSKHHVCDEIWEVHGGMPSGSPATSVGNSLCNLLVVRTAMYACEGYMPDHYITTYGDDVIMGVDGAQYTQNYCKCITEYFGMEATNTDKTGTDIRSNIKDATFLKRNFRPYEDTSYVVGVLDKTSMDQKIMWCHGIDAFKTQILSYQFELVLHGEQTYKETMAKHTEKLLEHGVVPLTWEYASTQVKKMIFE